MQLKIGTFLKKNFPIIAILTIAFAIRLLAVLRYGDFWFDELFSITYSQKPWLESLRHFWIWETNPPLHMLLLKLWFYIFPISEFFARLPSVLAAVWSIWALYNFSSKLFNKRVAAMASLLLALSSYHIFISATARIYTLLILLTILSVDYFHRIYILNENTKKNRCLYFIISLLLLFAHLTAGLVFISELAVCAILARKKIKGWIFSLIPIGVVWLVWFIPSVLSKFNTQTIGLAWFFNIIPSIRSIVLVLQELFSGLTQFPFSVAVILVVTVATIGLITLQIRSKAISQNFLILLILILIPIASAAIFNLWNIKFLEVTIPWSMVLVAYLICSYTSSPHVSALIILIFSVPGLLGLNTILPIQNWKPINEYLAAQYRPEKKQIFIVTYFPDTLMINYYFKSPIARLPYYPYETSSANWDYNIITKNYYRVRHSSAEVATWATNHHIDTYQEIFLLDSNPDTDVPLGEYLEAHGWQKRETTKVPLLYSDIIVHYVHP